jgi:signal transduction histidine kinase
VQTAREDERARVAREVHDVLGQALTGLKIDIGWLARRLGGGEKEVAARVADMSRLIDSTIQVVRRIARELRPVILDDLGLAAAVQWQAREFEAHSGIPVDLVECVNDVDVPSSCATGVFRIYQEILTNVARHAGASHVSVRLARQAGALLLEVRDDGRGMSESQRNGAESLGLLVMRERATLLDGTLEFDGAPGAGTTIRLRVPLRGEELRA